MTEDSQVQNTDIAIQEKNDACPPDSPRSVKSTAIVKYSAHPTPATFAQLQCNTNLNLPPSNWLSTAAECYGLQNVWCQTTGFSSFRMAHMFPDCVGEVDVVSDAENIKKLLKLPYSHGLVSMMVHRVENTLLLDDFDIHKYLLRQCENDWEWLKKFFYEHVFENLADKDKRLFPKASSRNAIQQKNLISKFLYHSLVLERNEETSTSTPPLPLQPQFKNLPEPTLEEELPDPNSHHNYTRNVVWTFENIQMLLGTDMPIFGGQTHPCISLRLRDSTKPISVLTGIDYWLDNLMSNVPEVVMCYHLDGIVQKYELIKTEDLPNLDNAKFSPRVIRDIAQNILSFLKNNATKAGHTYWLFKGKNDDVVKLYDLTSLCNDVGEDKNQNPFTVPVAMLLYRVARNMKYSTDCSRNRGTIRMLLKNCVQLLSKEKYPQIVTSAHFMLSDLYVPGDTDPACPNFSDQNDEEDRHNGYMSNEEGGIDEDDTNVDVNAAIKCLALTDIKERQIKDNDFEGFKFKPPPIIGTVEERCKSSLEHVSYGLECLKYFPNKSNEDESTSEQAKTDYCSEEKPNVNQDEVIEEYKTAKPYEAIPMSYESLRKSGEITEECYQSVGENSPTHKKKNKQKKKKSEKVTPKNENVIEDNTNKSLLCKLGTETVPTWQAPKKDDNHSWETHFKILLYEKAMLVFSVLAENEYSNKKYGSALRYIVSVLRCQKLTELFFSTKNDKLITYVLGRAGDYCFMIVQDWANVDKHQEDYKRDNHLENTILTEDFLKDKNAHAGDILPKNFDTIEATLIASYKCYEKAIALKPLEIDRNNLLRRLGNIHNELGVLYMNQASAQHQESQKNVSDETLTDSTSTDVTKPLLCSLTHLGSGVRAFESVHDEANLALLHSNIGRLMRLCAHLNTKQYTKERQFYVKALSSYQKALQVLGNRKTNPTIWDSVTWELSTTLFTMATYLQDYPDISAKPEEEIEREVVETFQKALKYCDTETSGPRQPIYQFRAAVIQHRLASLYHKIYRESNAEPENSKRKNSLQLSKLYYEKASKLLFALEETTEYLTVQMERVALAEFQAQISNNFNGKLKAYQNCLELILQCKPMIDLIVERNKNVMKKETVKNFSCENLENAEGTANNSQKCNENDSKDKVDERSQIDNEDSLVNLLEQRLQFVLRSLTKICMNKCSANQNKEAENYANIYKKCYALTLHPDSLTGVQLIEHISSILLKIIDILNMVENF